MADEARDDGDGDGGSIAAAGISSHRSDSPREIKPAAETVDGVDFISSMPDEILHHIFSFLPIYLAIRTSLLSRRWRHVWCETPCLDFMGDCFDRRRELTAKEIDQTLSFYGATKITSFLLSITRRAFGQLHAIDRWIEFAMSRNVAKLSLRLPKSNTSCPDSFYRSSSLAKLTVYFDMNPGCAVSWKSLRNLTLCGCNLFDESIANILSGSPILETLSLVCSSGPERLDLSKSPTLRRLDINNYCWGRGPTEIVAPHIHYLRLECTKEVPSTLVHVSSLAEANLDIGMDGYRRFGYDFLQSAGFLQTMVLKMLAELQNVERLTFGGNFLQILSLAELCGVTFPTLKVRTLTLRTKFERSVIPGITRLLQNSPGLKKLIAHATGLGTIEDCELDRYLDSQGLDPDQRWISEYEVFPSSDEFRGMVSCSELVASFMEMVLRNVKTLETLGVGLEHLDFRRDPKWFEELLQMSQTLSNNNNVSIVLRR